MGKEHLELLGWLVKDVRDHEAGGRGGAAAEEGDEGAPADPEEILSFDGFGHILIYALD